MDVMFNTLKLHEELTLANIPIFGCDATGKIDFRPEATPQQIADADVIKAAHNPLTPSTLVQNIIDTAQSAAGKLLSDLTTAERNALLACMLYKAGGVGLDGRVKPIGQWLR